jgi:hypothetical protein
VTDLTAEAALNAALAAAQGEFPSIPRDKTVTVETRTGRSYTFSYAPLDTILALVRPVLSKHGLAFTQQLEFNGHAQLRTELRHAEGGVIGSSFPLGSWETPQQLGSATTYIRRYAATAILGIAAEEDDDGNHAAGNTAQPEPDEPAFATEKQAKLIWALLSKAEKNGLATSEQLREQMGAQNGTENPRELTPAQASKVITDLKALLGEE